MKIVLLFAVMFGVSAFANEQTLSCGASKGDLAATLTKDFKNPKNDGIELRGFGSLQPDLMISNPVTLEYNEVKGRVIASTTLVNGNTIQIIAWGGYSQYCSGCDKGTSTVFQHAKLKITTPQTTVIKKAIECNFVESAD